MGIYLPNMEMPTNCLSCPLQGGTADCRLTQKTYNWGLTEHPSDCPLVPVPKHGRLGDLDRLAKEVKDMAKEFPPDSIGAERYRLFAEFIKTAPTIIPADPAEEGK